MRRIKGRIAAGFLLGLLALAGGIAVLTRGGGKANTAPTASAGVSAEARDSEALVAKGSPTTLDDGRMRGPDGLVLKLPPGWRLEPGSNGPLWGTLRPSDSKDPYPRIGVGSINLKGGEARDAMDAVNEILNELIPEIPSESRMEGGDNASIGRGEFGGVTLVQARRLRVVGDRLAIVWGMFGTDFPAPEDAVKRVMAGMSSK